VNQDSDDDFRGWVLARREPLRRSAFLMCGDWFLADDLVQEAVARVYSVWERVSLRGDPDAYTRRVVVNLLTDHRRRPWRREVAHSPLPEADLTTDVDSDSNGDLQAVLLTALASLPARQRAVLVLRFWEDLSLDQTASILNCSTGTVKSTSSKALVKLRTALAGTGVGMPLTTTKDS
jgi:RNA polymerase sigma-70 factor (sigma-E family)